MKIYVNKIKLEVKDKLKYMEDMMKPITPFWSGNPRTLAQEAKYLQEKVDEFEDQENQDASQLIKVQNSRANSKRESRYWENNDA